MSMIFKYPLPSPVSDVALPVGSVVLAFDLQRGSPTLWALVDETVERETRTFHVLATGQPFGGVGLRYIGTGQNEDGSLVLHCFEVVR